MIRNYTFTYTISLCIALFSSIVNSQVGIGTANPDASASLDITSSNSGLLIPRVSLESTTDVVTITSPQTSLLVYNTNTSTGATAVIPGFYYYDSARWVAMGTGSEWALLGNAGTNPTLNYVGTSDNQVLSLATNTTSRVQLSNNSFQMRAMGNGTEGAPFYSWNNDRNTGMWLRGADDLSLASGGVEFIRLDEGGTDVLVINEDSENSFDVRMEGANEQNLFFLDGFTDRIGIGTSNPGSRLDVFSNTRFAINTVGRQKGIFASSQTANVGSSGGSFILDNDANAGNGRIADGVMAGVIQGGSIVGAYGLVNTADNNWGMYTTDNSVALQFFTFSDSRLKSDIQEVTGALNQIKKLRPVEYFWDTKRFPSFGSEKRKQIGFLAQELEEVFPELVNKASVSLPESDTKATGQKFDAVNYDGLIPVLTKALQEQQEIIEKLEKRIEILEQNSK